MAGNSGSPHYPACEQRVWPDLPDKRPIPTIESRGDRQRVATAGQFGLPPPAWASVSDRPAPRGPIMKSRWWRCPSPIDSIRPPLMARSAGRSGLVGARLATRPERTDPRRRHQQSRPAHCHRARRRIRRDPRRDAIAGLPAGRLWPQCHPPARERGADPISARLKPDQLDLQHDIIGQLGDRSLGPHPARNRSRPGQLAGNHRSAARRRPDLGRLSHRQLCHACSISTADCRSRSRRLPAAR